MHQVVAAEADKRAVLTRNQAVVAALVGGASAQVVATLAAVLILIVMVARQGLSAPEDIEALSRSPKLLLLASPTVSLTLLATALVAPWVTRASLRSALGIYWPRSWLWLPAMLAVPGVGSLGDLLAVGLSQLAPDFSLGTGLVLVEASRVESLILLIPVLAILPSLAEEFFFRGMLLRALGRSWRTILVVGCVFALYHVDPPHVVATLPIGIYLSWLALRTESTLLCVAVHLFNNLLALLAGRVEHFRFGFGTERTVPAVWLLASIGVALVALFVMRRGTEPSAAEP
jgi:membrane protease YdiL (CAAX protease family)